MVYFLREISDTLKATERFLAVSGSFGVVKRLRTGDGTKFISSNFRSLMAKKKIKQEIFAPYWPHQNRAAERSWTLFDMSFDTDRFADAVVALCTESSKSLGQKKLHWLEEEPTLKIFI